MTPQKARDLIRENKLNRTTSGVSYGYTQANLVVLKKELAFEFLLFCQRNPKSCPVLDVTEIGSPAPKLIASDADIRTDLPRYRIYKNGKLIEQTKDILKYWTDDMVAFLLGCSYTFESALLNNNIPVRHIELNEMVPAYITNIESEKAGRFEGPIVVSMRPIPEEDIVRAVQVTSRYPNTHGAPVHIGNPESIGISDINKPNFGSPVPIKKGEVPVFWACGVTPQAVAMEVKPELMITHDPGYMFISDITDESLTI